ncbi:MAG: YbhB/YbcL family Raf kinase inhibitor-like protein [Phycisphaerae bacterium]
MHIVKRSIFLISLFIFPAMVSNAESLLEYQSGKTPTEIGNRLVDNLLARDGYMLYSDQWLHYAEACTAYSAYRFAGLTDNKELTEKLDKRYAWIFDSELISTKHHVDQAVIGILPLEMYMQNRGEKFREIGLWFADRQWKKPLENGLTSQSRWWIDDMYMVGMLQMQAYRVTGNEIYADRAAMQTAAYLEKLQQPSGLFYHGPDYHHYWGRGNGWVASALTEVLKSLPQDNPHREKIMQSYKKMTAALLKYQSKDGMWRQLIDNKDSWPESSCTAMFTYAMLTGIKNGWLDKDEYQPAVQKSWDALLTYLDDNGNLREICTGTGQNKDVQYYLDRPRVLGDLHGQAPMLWCICELLETKSLNSVSKKGGNAMDIELTSTAFENGAMIPPIYTCDGDDISPPLKWDSVPDGTQSIALIADDPDAPKGTWVHWVLYNLPPDKTQLQENFPDDETLEDRTRQGVTDFGKTGYGGPCPPSGTHRYYFKIYALNTMIDTTKLLDKKTLLEKMEGHILAQGELMGKYKRK